MHFKNYVTLDQCTYLMLNWSQTTSVIEHSFYLHQESQLTKKFQDIDIGDFKDKNTPLIYCFRFIAKNFLLAGYPNSTIPDKITRVSVKSLALSCLSSIISLHPHIFLQYLDKNASKNSTDSQQISDLLLYENHGDPQLRGNVMILVASFVKAVCLDSFGKYDVWVRENCGVENLDVFRVDGMVNLLIKVSFFTVLF